MANKNQEYTEQYADYAMEQMRRYGIARLFEPQRPAFVVVGRERETTGIAVVLFQEA